MNERAPEPVESGERAERTENTEQQRLDDATFEPQTLIEQTGNYPQAETIQNTFTAVVDSAGSAEAIAAAAAPVLPAEAVPIVTSGASSSPGKVEALSNPILIPSESKRAVVPDDSLRGQEPQAAEGPFEPGGGSGDGGENITPINLPNIRMTTQTIDEGSTSAAARPSGGGREVADPGSGEGISPQRESGEPPPAVEPVTGELYVAPSPESPTDSTGAGETGEQTTPPDWYVSVGPDGKITVVDKDGNPVETPPNIQLNNPDGTFGTPHACYAGSDGETFDLPYYSGSLDGCSVVIGADGKPVVVDTNGKPLAVQPNVQTVNPDGTPCDPKAYYSGGQDNPVDLPLFTPRLDNCSVNVGSDGQVTVVDGNGVPLPIQPTVEMYNADGTPKIPPKVYYNGQDDEYYQTTYIPGSYQTEAQTLPFYSGSLKGCLVNIGADGKPVVVDANGKPLAVQPNIQLQNPDGTPCLKASYSGNTDNPVDLPLYAGSLDGCSVQIGADGKPVVVDAGGKPLAIQPDVELTDQYGNPITPKASYSGSEGNPIGLPLYSGSLEKCFVNIGADGKPTVVDASGKPLPVQPVIQTVNPDGTPCTPKAYYSGNKDKPVELPPYKGPQQPSAAK
jgi:hypothetical protein